MGDAPAVEGGIDLARDHDRRVQALPQPGERVALRVHVDMQRRVARPQLRQAPDQTLRCKKRRHVEPKPHPFRVATSCVYCNAERVDRRGDPCQELLAIRIQDHRLMPPLEQGFADKPLQ